MPSAPSATTAAIVFAEVLARELRQPERGDQDAARPAGRPRRRAAASAFMVRPAKRTETA